MNIPALSEIQFRHSRNQATKELRLRPNDRQYRPTLPHSDKISLTLIHSFITDKIKEDADYRFKQEN
jgi:hypothetical protein